MFDLCILVIWATILGEVLIWENMPFWNLALPVPTTLLPIDFALLVRDIPLGVGLTRPLMVNVSGVFFIFFLSPCILNFKLFTSC